MASQRFANRSASLREPTGEHQGRSLAIDDILANHVPNCRAGWCVSRTKIMAEGTVRTPELPEIGIVAYVPDNWDWKWQPRHHVLSRLSRYFHVIWVSPALDWRDAIKFWASEDSRPSVSIPSNLHLMTTSRTLPRFYRPQWLRHLTEKRRWDRAASKLRSLGCRKIVAYLWRPEFAEVLEFNGHDCTCYHIDDEYSFSSVDFPISEMEHGVIAKVDQVFIHSPKLFE